MQLRPVQFPSSFATGLQFLRSALMVVATSIWNKVLELQFHWRAGPARITAMMKWSTWWQLSKESTSAPRQQIDAMDRKQYFNSTACGILGTWHAEENGCNLARRNFFPCGDAVGYARFLPQPPTCGTFEAPPVRRGGPIGVRVAGRKHREPDQRARHRATGARVGRGPGSLAESHSMVQERQQEAAHAVRSASSCGLINATLPDSRFLPFLPTHPRPHCCGPWARSRPPRRRTAKQEAGPSPSIGTLDAGAGADRKLRGSCGWLL